jgi:hypothetical protein
MFARTYVTSFDSGFVKYLVYVVFVLGRWGSCVLYTLFANKRSPVSVIISKHAKHVCVCVLGPEACGLWTIALWANAFTRNLLVPIVCFARYVILMWSRLHNAIMCNTFCCWGCCWVMSCWSHAMAKHARASLADMFVFTRCVVMDCGSYTHGQHATLYQKFVLVGEYIHGETIYPTLHNLRQVVWSRRTSACKRNVFATTLTCASVLSLAPAPLRCAIVFTLWWKLHFHFGQFNENTC